MSAEAITELQKHQASHEVKIHSLEQTIETVFPPLLDKLDKLTERLHENSEVINLSVQKSTQENNSSKEWFGRVEKRQDKAEVALAKLTTELTLLSNEVIQSRPIMDMISGLGKRLLFAALVVVGAAAAIIINVK